MRQQDGREASFEEAWKQVEHQLKLRVEFHEQTKDIGQILQLLIERRPGDAPRWRRIQDIASARNKVIHAMYLDGERMFAPTEELVRATYAVLDELQRPQRALDRLRQVRERQGPAISVPVLTLSPDDALRDALDQMGRYDFSQMPVCEKDAVVGMLTTERVTAWIAGELSDSADSAVLLDRRVRVRELVDALPADDTAEWEIASRKVTCIEVVDRFRERMLAGQPLRALLITHKGQRDSLEGIVTPYDLAWFAAPREMAMTSEAYLRERELARARAEGAGGSAESS